MWDNNSAVSAEILHASVCDRAHLNNAKISIIIPSVMF